MSTATGPPAEPTPGRATSGRGRRLGKITLAVMVVGGLLAADLTRPPERQLATRTLTLAIRAYRASLSPVLGFYGVHCRFTPTCSAYGLEVVRRFGAWRGGLLAARRILRCGPWTQRGTKDPPPVTLPGVAGTPTRTDPPPGPS